MQNTNLVTVVATESTPDLAVAANNADKLMSDMMIPGIVLGMILVGVIYTLTDLFLEWNRNRKLPEEERQYTVWSEMTCTWVISALWLITLGVGIVLANHCLTTAEIASRLNTTFGQVTFRGPLYLAFALKAFALCICTLCICVAHRYYKDVLRLKTEDYTC